MSKETIQFMILLGAQVIAALIAVWKFGGWTESVNNALLEFKEHTIEDKQQFRTLNNKYDALILEVVRNSNRPAQGQQQQQQQY